MKYDVPQFRLWALMSLLILPICCLTAGPLPEMGSLADTLNRTRVGFAQSSTIVVEGAGRLEVELVVEAAGQPSGQAAVRVAEGATAVEGVDYIMHEQAFSLTPGTPSHLKASLDILDNGQTGGRYLVLELVLPDSNLLAPGKRTSHIVLIQDKDTKAPTVAAPARAKLSHLGSYRLPKGASAEIIAYDASSSRLFVSNLEQNKLEILDFRDPADIRTVKSLQLDIFGGHINAVAAHGGTVALAIEGEESTGPGRVVFLNADGIFISAVEVGAMPDMLLFSPDGSKVLSANEGEPTPDYRTDPEGSVSIIDISRGAANPEATTVGFTAFNGRREELAARGVRIYGPGASVAQDLEPEYIALSDDGATAYVTCQENNALAVINLAVPEVVDILPLGYKDWSAEGCVLDVSNRSGGIFFANWPVRGMYQPDAIEYFTVGDKAYLATANEGSARDYKGFTEEFRVKDKEVVLDERFFPGARYLKDDVLLGRLHVSGAMGDIDGDGQLEELYAFGGRSFSIWDAATGELVYDSGGALEQITAADPVFGALFNTQNDKNDFKARSDDKGPEPASVQVAELNGVTLGFIGLERIGGVMLYDFTQPRSPQFLQYINSRAVDSLGGDLSPEGMIYIAPEDSPTGFPYVLAAHEVSGSVAVFELETAPAVCFAEATAILEEGAGKMQIELAIEKPGKLGGEARIKVLPPSSAKEGVDFYLPDTTLVFEAGAEGTRTLAIDLLDNDTPGPRYLILEIDAEASTVHVGETSRCVLLIQDNDERARR